MRFTMNRDALAHAVQVAGRVASRGTTPAMACVLMEAGEDSVSFSATDGDRHVEHSDSAMVEEEGKCLVSAKALSACVKSLKDGAVCVSSVEGRVSVECCGGSFTLPSLDPREWVGAPVPEEGPSCRIGAESLKAMAKAVAPFCDIGKEAQERLSAIHLASDGSEMRLEATEGHIVCVRSHPADGDALDCLVPRDFLLSAAESMEGDVSIMSDGKRVEVSCGPTRMTSRLVSLSYPELDRYIPKERDGMTVAREDLLGMLRRASQVGDGKGKLSLRAEGGSLSASVSTDAGSFSETCPCSGDLDVYAACHFVRMCAEAMGCEEVIVVSTAPMKPVLFVGDSTLAVAMPLRRDE